MEKCPKKGYILYDFIYIIFLKLNYKNEKSSLVARVREGEKGRGYMGVVMKRSRRNHSGVETVLYLDCGGGYTNPCDKIRIH